MQGLAGDVFLGDLTLKFAAVGAVLGHGFHPSKARQPWSIPNLQSVHPQGRTPRYEQRTIRHQPVISAPSSTNPIATMRLRHWQRRLPERAKLAMTSARTICFPCNKLTPIAYRHPDSGNEHSLRPQCPDRSLAHRRRCHHHGPVAVYRARSPPTRRTRSSYRPHAGNVALDGVVGAVPLAGDAFDVIWRANRRNVRLLTDWLNQEERRADAVTRY